MEVDATHLAWRYERFSLAQLGPVHRVGLTGQGFTGKGRLAMTPFDRLSFPPVVSESSPGFCNDLGINGMLLVFCKR